MESGESSYHIACTDTGLKTWTLLTVDTLKPLQPTNTQSVKSDKDRQTLSQTDRQTDSNRSGLKDNQRSVSQTVRHPYRYDV